MSKDLTHKLNGSLEDKVDWLVAAVQSIDSRVQSIDSRVQSIDSRVESVETRLGNLETKVDERLQDTRPMWEAVQTQLAGLQSEFKADLGELRSEFKAELEGLRHETEKGFRRLGHKYELHATSLADLHADWRDHEERLDKLEKVES